MDVEQRHMAGAGRLLLIAFLWTAGLIVIASVGSLARPAHAASFDCAAATQPLEKIICADEDLSALDEKMAATYKETQAKLDGDAAQTIKTSQRAWLKFLRAYCGATDRAGWTTAECLDMEYDTRIQDLAGAIIVQPAFTFLQVAEYQTIKIDAEPEYDRPAETGRHYFSYPQIIAPKVAETARWNDDMQKWARSVVGEWIEMDGNPQVEISATVRTSLPNFVSVEKSVYWMGAAHMWGTYWNENVLLTTGQELTAAQIFKSGSGWESFLSTRAFNAIELESGSPEITRDLIESLVEEPQTWTVSADTLTITVDPDGTDSRRYGAIEVVYTWRELGPFLQADLPIALNVD
ncbi:lysozyme inhibitor LprI family protein [Dongia sp.]|jgi:uncharacterized protein|uniref:lysozyme inhibitor LprI family protein n=1 Tax=Dongia sp. TaxID=1977262 RepID=UPI0034A30161